MALRALLRTRVHLLIEPVWNRNVDEFLEALKEDVSFNRTSMESKLLCHPTTVASG